MRRSRDLVREWLRRFHINARRRLGPSPLARSCRRQPPQETRTSGRCWPVSGNIARCAGTFQIMTGQAPIAATHLFNVGQSSIHFDAGRVPSWRTGQLQSLLSLQGACSSQPVDARRHMRVVQIISDFVFQHAFPTPNRTIIGRPLRVIRKIVSQSNECPTVFMQWVGTGSSLACSAQSSSVCSLPSMTNALSVANQPSRRSRSTDPRVLGQCSAGSKTAFTTTFTLSSVQASVSSADAAFVKKRSRARRPCRDRAYRAAGHDRNRSRRA